MTASKKKQTSICDNKKENHQPMKKSTEIQYEPISNSEYEALKSIRQKGYAVVVFNPEELQTAIPRKVEDAVVLAGWDAIDALKD
jgi:hypothetical protein